MSNKSTLGHISTQIFMENTLVKNMVERILQININFFFLQKNFKSQVYNYSKAHLFIL